MNGPLFKNMDSIDASIAKVNFWSYLSASVLVERKRECLTLEIKKRLKAPGCCRKRCSELTAGHTQALILQPWP